VGVRLLDFWRQIDIISTSLLKGPITVIGAGGIGSPTILALAKMGCSDLLLYEDDKVESHNLPNQMYRLDDVGKPKVEATEEIVKIFTGLDIRGVCQRVTGDHTFGGIVIAAVDTMASRQEIWQNIIWKPQVDLYIDARMGGEVARVFCIRPCDPDYVDFYKENLYSDEEASDLPCTAQAIIYNVFCIASLIANSVKRFVKGEELCAELIFDFATLTFIKRSVSTK
jgi:molybdopterin/thiamine biosynthesis adenylyltransferase